MTTKEADYLFTGILLAVIFIPILLILLGIRPESSTRYYSPKEKAMLDAKEYPCAPNYMGGCD